MRLLVAWFCGVVVAMASPVAWTWGAVTDRSAVIMARVVAEGDISLMLRTEGGCGSVGDVRAGGADERGAFAAFQVRGSVPWNGAPMPVDRRQGYAEHRAEIANFIKTEGIANVCMLAGCAHMTAIDDGSNSDFATGGGAPLPVFQAGPIANKGSYKGGPYSHGARADTPPGELLRQFGLVDVADDGRERRVTWSGREGSDGVGDQVLVAQTWGAGKIERTFRVR